MFDIGWEKLLLISTVALVAIGPKDLPKALRTVGRAVGKMRRMASEFQAQFNEAIREADLEDLRKSASDINDAVAPFKSGFNPLANVDEQLQKAVGPLPSISDPVVAANEPPVTPVPEKAPENKTTSKGVRKKTGVPKPDAPPAKISAKKAVAVTPGTDKKGVVKKPTVSRAKKKADKPDENVK